MSLTWVQHWIHSSTSTCPFTLIDRFPNINLHTNQSIATKRVLKTRCNITRACLCTESFTIMICMLLCRAFGIYRGCTCTAFLQSTLLSYWKISVKNKRFHKFHQSFNCIVTLSFRINWYSLLILRTIKHEPVTSILLWFLPESCVWFLFHSRSLICGLLENLNCKSSFLYKYWRWSSKI